MENANVILPRWLLMDAKAQRHGTLPRIWWSLFSAFLRDTTTTETPAGNLKSTRTLDFSNHGVGRILMIYRRYCNVFSLFTLTKRSFSYGIPEEQDDFFLQKVLLKNVWKSIVQLRKFYVQISLVLLDIKSTYKCMLYTIEDLLDVKDHNQTFCVESYF